LKRPLPQILGSSSEPTLYPNTWYGERELFVDFDEDGTIDCTDTIYENGEEITEDFTGPGNWLDLCDCDEIYEIVATPEELCGYDVTQLFYRGVKYLGFNPANNTHEIEIKWWTQGGGTPYPPVTLSFGNPTTNTPSYDGWDNDYHNSTVNSNVNNGTHVGNGWSYGYNFDGNAVGGYVEFNDPN